jgi:hypothetical protein
VQWSQPRPPSRSHKTISRIGYGVAGVRSRARKLFRHVEDRIFGPAETAWKPPAREAPARNGNGKHAPEKTVEKTPEKAAPVEAKTE